MSAPRVPGKAREVRRVAVEAPKSAPVLPGAKEACADCGSTTRQLLDTDQVKERYGFRVKLVGKRDIACWRELRKAKRLKGQARRQETTFGITLDERDELIEFQGGGCICMEWTGYNGNSRSLSTDHDHKTGVVRGALCKHCNDLLGRIRDNPAYFRRMIAYLENPPAVRLFGARVVPGHGEE